MLDIGQRGYCNVLIYCILFAMFDEVLGLLSSYAFGWCLVGQYKKKVHMICTKLESIAIYKYAGIFIDNQGRGLF